MGAEPAVTLVLATDLAAELSRVAGAPLETAGVLLVRVVRDGDQVRLLGRGVRWVPLEHYQRRTAHGLTIRSGGYVGALREAADSDSVALWVHSHPSGSPIPSRADAIVDTELRDVFRGRTGQEVYGSIVIGPDREGLRFTGTLLDGAASPARIGRIWVVGQRFRSIIAADVSAEPVADVFDRQVRALGPAMQQTLRHLKVGLVGAGGTGSAVGEMLGRLGVGQLVVIDPDTLAATNVTRVHGTGLGDVGRPKAELVCEHVKAIGLGTATQPVVGTIVDRQVAQHLRTCDLIFGCTDDNGGRIVLSRLSTFYLVPVIDCGVLVSSDSGVISGIDGRVTVLSPGYACLLCRDRVDPRQAALEQISAAEREQLVAEGYAPGLGPGAEPAVVAYTTMVAALAVNEMLERLVAYGVDPPPSELLVRIHDRAISTNTRPALELHYCADGAVQRGAGDREPMLEMAWVSG